MKKSALFYTLLTHLTFSMDLLEETPQSSSLSTHDTNATNDVVSLAKDISQTTPKHSTEEIRSC